MLGVADAQKIVRDQATPLAPRLLPLHTDVLGLMLAEDIASDIDMPPFDKAMMDGFAVRTHDLSAGKAELAIIEEIMAGATPSLPVKRGQASRIMTGAPVPEGADAVVMMERCEMLPSNRVRVQDDKLAPAHNILSRAHEMRSGETVLRVGARLRPQEFGVLASVGRTAVKVYPAPRVAVIATGDELVEPHVKPGAGQIRNSNGPMVLAQVARAGAVPRFVGIARDEPEHLRALISEGLSDDVLILSGGVSAGKLDLVPGVLADLGVQALFHKVALKPGKPMLFGVRPRANGDGPPKLIFGLPGNPVSSLVCFELFVRPAMRGLMALPPGPPWVKALLTKDYPFRTDRPTFHPAHLRATGSGWTVEPVRWSGSSDLRSTGPSNAFVRLPEGDHHHRSGDVLDVLILENDWFL